MKSLFILAALIGITQLSIAQSTDSASIDYTLTTQLNGTWKQTRTVIIKTGDTTIRKNEIETFSFSVGEKTVEAIYSGTDGTIRQVTPITTNAVLTIINILERHYASLGYKVYQLDANRIALKGKTRIKILTKQ
ncbi:MAG: hypothetical protein KDC92_17150 [Bacteroidetes bacterium]|nr:hypothetical protein [Bacteroidota bacterium]